MSTDAFGNSPGMTFDEMRQAGLVDIDGELTEKGAEAIKGAAGPDHLTKLEQLKEVENQAFDRWAESRRQLTIAQDRHADLEQAFGEASRAFNRAVAEAEAPAGQLLSIDLDIDLPDEEVKQGMGQHFSITLEKLVAHGPGGGCGVWRFTGTEDNLVEWLAEYYLGESEANAAEYLHEFKNTPVTVG